MPCSPPAPLPGDPERRNVDRAILPRRAVCHRGAFVASLRPARVRRGAAVEVDNGDLAPRDMKIVERRGKPVWVVRRTPEMVAAVEHPSPELADPDSQREQQPAYAQNATRSIKPDVFVVVGICTHLGCSPTAMPAGSNNPSLPSDWPGGYFCPCHGSTFDGAGRVFKNKPAPTNLEVPPYQFLGDARLLIGDDQRSA
jgi:ubiquinol-cytochrome c reductase iron-sulfur subunit